MVVPLQKIFTTGGRLCDDDSALLEAHKDKPSKMFVIGELQEYFVSVSLMCVFSGGEGEFPVYGFGFAHFYDVKVLFYLVVLRYL